MSRKRAEEADMTVMGVSGEIAILRPEDKLIVRIPGLTQEYANAVARSLDEQLGERRSVVLPEQVSVMAVPPGEKVVFRVWGLTAQIVDVLEPMLARVFGEDGFIIVSGDMIEVATEPKPEA